MRLRPESVAIFGTEAWLSAVHGCCSNQTGRPVEPNSKAQIGWFVQDVGDSFCQAETTQEDEDSLSHLNFDDTLLLHMIHAALLITLASNLVCHELLAHFFPCLRYKQYTSAFSQASSLLSMNGPVSSFLHQYLLLKLMLRLGFRSGVF